MSGLSMSSIYIINEQLGVISIFLFVFLIYTTFTTLINNREFNLHWQDNNDWIMLRQGEPIPAKLCDNSVITPVCSVLNFRLEDGSRQSILIFKDNIDAQSYRRFRVRVKVQGINPRAHDTIGA